MTSRWLASALVTFALLFAATSAASPVPLPKPSRVAPSARFGWPVTPHEVARRFQPPKNRWGPGHRGVDLCTRPGAQVVAPAAGSITFSGVVAGRGVVAVRHPQGFSTTYEPVSSRIASGTEVQRGQRIGTLDPGHRGDGYCLHWGYRIGKDEYRDPLTLVRGVRPVLLPPTSW